MNYIPKPREKFIAINRKYGTDSRVGAVTCKTQHKLKKYVVKITATDDDNDEWQYPLDTWRFRPQSVSTSP